MLTLDSMSPEMHRRIEFSLHAIREEIDRCRDLHAQFLTNLTHHGIEDYGTVLTASALAKPIASPVFRVRVRQQLSCLHRVAVGVERHAVDYDTLAATEGAYLCQQAWRWHVFIEIRRRQRPGFEDAFAPLQRVAGRIATDRARLLPKDAPDASRDYWSGVERWGRGEGSAYLDDITH